MQGEQNRQTVKQCRRPDDASWSEQPARKQLAQEQPGPEPTWAEQVALKWPLGVVARGRLGGGHRGLRLEAIGGVSSAIQVSCHGKTAGSGFEETSCQADLRLPDPGNLHRSVHSLIL